MTAFSVGSKAALGCFTGVKYGVLVNGEEDEGLGHVALVPALLAKVEKLDLDVNELEEAELPLEDADKGVVHVTGEESVAAMLRYPAEVREASMDLRRLCKLMEMART